MASYIKLKKELGDLAILHKDHMREWWLMREISRRDRMKLERYHTKKMAIGRTEGILERKRRYAQAWAKTKEA